MSVSLGDMWPCCFIQDMCCPGYAQVVNRWRSVGLICFSPGFAYVKQRHIIGSRNRRGVGGSHGREPPLTSS